MKCYCHCALGILLGLCAMPEPARAAEAAEKVRLENKQWIDFATGGVIRMLDSFGEVYIEGWDQPRVEIVWTRATQKKYRPEDREEALRQLERVEVQASKAAENELVVATRFPSRNLFTRPLRGKSNLELVYRIKAPRETTLQIQHSIGGVKVKDIRGNIRVTNGIGEITLVLPESGRYEIDANAGIGDVSSAFGRQTKRRHLIGASLAESGAQNARRLYLRVGIGEINIKKIPE